jgi:predicted amidohydrolase
MKVVAAALQLPATPGEVDANLARLEEAVAELPRDVTLAVAPELVNTGYDLDLIARVGRKLAEPADGPSVDRIARLAHRYRLTMIAGFLESAGDVLFDSIVVAGPEGERAVYRKTHLYPAEQPIFSAGSELVTTEADGFRLGVMICFEHAFPEIATTLALKGAEIVVIPSAVPEGYEHLLWLRTRARAQDNQVFVVACNMTGTPFCGGSLIVDPRGDILARAGEGVETIVATLDSDNVAAERAREPSLRLRRRELYE